MRREHFAQGASEKRKSSDDHHAMGFTS